MIKQDYLLRMIEEIISMIVTALFGKKKIKQSEWTEYDSIAKQIMGFETEKLTDMDADDVINSFENDNNRVDKIEMTAMIMLKMSEDIKENIVVSSRLRQNGLELLKYADRNSNMFSLQRKQIIALIEMNK